MGQVEWVFGVVHVSDAFVSRRAGGPAAKHGFNRVAEGGVVIFTDSDLGRAGRRVCPPQVESCWWVVVWSGRGMPPHVEWRRRQQRQKD